MKLIGLKYITEYSNVWVFEQLCAVGTEAICGIGMLLAGRQTYQWRMNKMQTYLSRNRSIQELDEWFKSCDMNVFI